MKKNERTQRILARGEVSGHCHVVVGDVDIEQDADGRIILKVGNEGAVLKHLLETPWVEEEKEVWTGEHKDITLSPGVYDYVPQINYDPITDRIVKAID